MKWKKKKKYKQTGVHKSKLPVKLIALRNLVLIMTKIKVDPFHRLQVFNIQKKEKSKAVTLK